MTTTEVLKRNKSVFETDTFIQKLDTRLSGLINKAKKEMGVNNEVEDDGIVEYVILSLGGQRKDLTLVNKKDDDKIIKMIKLFIAYDLIDKGFNLYLDNNKQEEEVTSNNNNTSSDEEVSEDK